MSVAEATPDLEQVDRNDRAFLGHPKCLGFLGFTEASERFSYYSMQTLLVLYMVNYLLLPEHIGKVVGLDWLRSWHYPGLDGQPLSSAIFGDYTSLVYLTPILGGIIADRLTGRRIALIAGALVMALGHFLMAFEGAFLFALLALIIGVGLFKGNIATQVGELYSENDLRRAMAFQIFYIFINVSVIAAPLISGTLGQKVGWHSSRHPRARSGARRGSFRAGARSYTLHMSITPSSFVSTPLAGSTCQPLRAASLLGGSLSLSSEIQT